MDVIVEIVVDVPDNIQIVDFKLKKELEKNIIEKRKCKERHIHDHK